MRYSYKRISQYEPQNSGNKELKRIAYIQTFIKSLRDDKTMVFVLDEAGFGTNPLRHYSYSIIGKPALYKMKKLAHNLTCTATISDEAVEFVQFFYEGGTKKEYFAAVIYPYNYSNTFSIFPNFLKL